MPKNGGICYVFKYISQLGSSNWFQVDVEKEWRRLHTDWCMRVLQMPSSGCEASPSLNPTSKLSNKSGNESFSRRWFGEDSILASTFWNGLKKAPPSYIPRFLLIMLFWDHELVFIPTHPLWWMEQQKSHEHHPTREKRVVFCWVAGLFSLRSLFRKTIHWCIPPNKSGKLLTCHSTESKHVSPTSQMLETDGFQFELLNDLCKLHIRGHQLHI